VDPALKEAASLDGANAWQTFWRVTAAGAQADQHHRAGRSTVDRGAAGVRHRLHHQQGPQRLELLSILVTDNIIGEASRIGWGSRWPSCCWYLTRVHLT